MNPLRILPVLPAMLLSWLSFSVSRAAVNDVMPGDFFPPAQHSLALYAYDRNFSGPYAQGRQLLDGRIDSQALAVRAVWATRWQGYRVVPIMVLSAARSAADHPLDTLIGQQASGWGDARFGLSIWPLEDKEKARYLGVTAMLLAPTGDYEPRQVLNIGEHRWRFVLSGGFQQEIIPNLLFELSPEVAWYGDNDDYRAGRRLEQDNGHALTTYLRYRLSPSWHVHVGAQLNRGGATHIDGVDQNNPADNTRAMAGVTWIGSGGQQLILRLAQDTRIENGFKTRSEVMLRFSQSY